jgi:hypothetical protein
MRRGPGALYCRVVTRGDGTIGAGVDRLRNLTVTYFGALGLCIAMAIGAIGPWETLGPFDQGSVGGSGGDWVVLCSAAVAFIMLGGVVVKGVSMRLATTVSAIAAFVGTGPSIDDFVDPVHSPLAVDVQPGWGVMLSVIASVALLCASLSLRFTDEVA